MLPSWRSCLRAMATSALVLGCTPFTADPVGPTMDAGLRLDADTSPDLDGSSIQDGGADAGPPASSCKELHRARPELGSGSYPVRRPGGDVIQVYCDMVTADGGWTLVARSVKGTTATAFGWTVSTGDLDDDTLPYATDASALAEPGEILFGARGPGKTWRSPVYTRPLPASFMTSYTDTLSSPSGSTEVTGKCAGDLGPEQPTMLSRAGSTSALDHYAFSDQNATSSFGLYPGVWDTNGDNDDPPKCGYSGLLTGVEGMIFVR